MFDLVTVFHSDEYFEQFERLIDELCEELFMPWVEYGMDNRVENRGFARACNVGAAEGTNPIIGFLNPDLRVYDDFTLPVVDMFLRYQEVAITGERFGQPQRTVEAWGCEGWVCGGAFFIRRHVFEELGGFDERFMWGHEETDLIRRAEQVEYRVADLDLPISQIDVPDRPEDIAFKQQHYEDGRVLFSAKWDVVA